MQAWLLWLQVWSCGTYLAQGSSPRQWRSIEVDADGKLHGLPRERMLLQHPVHELLDLLQKVDQDDWSVKLRNVLEPASLLQEVPVSPEEIHLEPGMKGEEGAEEFDNDVHADKAPAPSATIDPEVKQWVDHTHHITQQVKEKTEKLQRFQDFNDGYTFGGDHSHGLSPPAPEPFAPNWGGTGTEHVQGQAEHAGGDEAARQALRQLANQLSMSHGAGNPSGGERYVEPVPERTPPPLMYAAPTPAPPFIHTVYSGYGPTMAPVVVPVIQKNAYGQERVVPVEVDQGTVRPGQPTARPIEINGIPVMPGTSVPYGWGHGEHGAGYHGWETTATSTTTTTAEAVSLTILPFVGLLIGICLVGCAVGFGVATLMAKKKAKKNGAEDGAGKQQDGGSAAAQQGPGTWGSMEYGGAYEDAGGYEEAAPEEAPFGEDGGASAAAAAADNTGGLVSSDTSRDPG